MSAEPSSPLRILLAEDNALNRRLALLVLARAGYEADVAANGEEVLEAVSRDRYDVVLMDVEMPEMDGLEATRRLRAGGHDLLIVVLTAAEEPGALQACIDAGVDEYLRKPLCMDDLIRVLGQHPVGALGTEPGNAASFAQIPEPGVLDPRVLGRITEALGDAGPALARRLLMTFLDETPDLVLRLRAAVDAGDAVLVRRTAHTLKSNAAGLGAARLAAVCREAEAKAGGQQLKAVADLLDDIMAEHERTCATIRLQVGDT